MIDKPKTFIHLAAELKNARFFLKSKANLQPVQQWMIISA